jgi:DHA1 family purine ribonucleoside efflux pump-like MFS transporter
MNPMNSTSKSTDSQTAIHPAWGAVFAMAMGVFSLVTAEFLPASLLTPMAIGLHMSEGLAGQAVTTTAAVALVTSLLISAATKGIDRKYVLLAFSLLLVVANLFVALANGFTAVLIGRVLLGVALGGFWTMAAATTMRLVPEDKVPRALSIIFSGVSVATIAAAPMGSYFGNLFGWRSVFFAASALGAVTFVAQLLTLPSLPAKGSAGLKTIIDVLRRPAVGIAMVATILVFTGHFIFFTYMRAALEQAAGVGVNTLSAILLGFGIANFIGTALAGRVLEHRLRFMLIAMPALMAVLAALLALFGSSSVLDFVLVALWGMAFGGVPVAWSTWVTRAVPDEAESAGGLIVAAIQLAISLGAAFGGVMFDLNGASGIFSSSAVILLLAMLLILYSVPSKAPAQGAKAQSFH